MKNKFLVSLAFCIITLNINAQQWYPENANWKFNIQELLSFQAHGYAKYAVVGDTVIQDTTAILIIKESFLYDGTISPKDSIYVHESNSRAYFWDGSHFKLMYDFNLNSGDTLNVHINVVKCDSVSAIIIDSISHIDIGGQNLKVQHLSYTLYAETVYGFNLNISEQIIERIGSERRFIYNPSCVIYHEYTYSGLRCYQDDNIYYKNEWWETHFPMVHCDSLIFDNTLNTQELKQNDFLIFPNPSSGYVTISNLNTYVDDIYVEIYNVSGGLLDKVSMHKTTTINLSNYNPGFYILKIYQNAMMVNMYKIIKK